MLSGVGRRASDVVGNEVMQGERTLQLAFFSFLDRRKAYHQLCVGDVQGGVRELSTYWEVNQQSEGSETSRYLPAKRFGFGWRDTGRKTDKGHAIKRPTFQLAGLAWKVEICVGKVKRGNLKRCPSSKGAWLWLPRSPIIRWWVASPGSMRPKLWPHDTERRGSGFEHVYLGRCFSYPWRTLSFNHCPAYRTFSTPRNPPWSHNFVYSPRPLTTKASLQVRA